MTMYSCPDYLFSKMDVKGGRDQKSQKMGDVIYGRLLSLDWDSA